MSIESSVENVLITIHEQHSLPLNSFCSTMCELSKSSYKNPDMLPSTDSVISFISEGESQCYIWKYNDTVAISFRGTESIGDIKDDISIIQRIFEVPKDHVNSLQRSMLVHTGIYKQFLCLEPKLSTILSGNISDSNKIIYVTGHSLGGGLATLASLYYSYKYANPIYCITFGSPRVGNKDFANTFNERIAKSVRFVNQEDPIPFFPSDIFYEHVCGIKYIDRNNKIQNKITNNRFLHCIKDFICSLCCCAEKPTNDHLCSDYLRSIKDADIDV